MSGLVPLSTIEDDFYVFDAARNNLVGRRTRRTIRLGDQLTVQVAKVDSFKKQVDFRLVEDRKSAMRPITGRPTQDKVGRSTGPAAWRSFTRPPRRAQAHPSRGHRRGGRG
jgi:ribonuclease R